MGQSPKKPVIAVVVAIEVIVAAFAWRDLSRRDDDEVRGKKRWWRVAMMANPGNSLAYWAFGRR